MEVKLHKGPQHGKTVVVREGQNSLIFSVVESGGMITNWRDPSPCLPKARTVEYRMKIIKHPDYGTFPCTDPYGRVYFEYVG